MNIGKAAVILAFAGLCLASASQGQGWQHTTETDELHGTMSDRFVVRGLYLTPPRISPADAVPLLVVTCSGGRVRQSYFSVGAVLAEDADSIFPVHMEARFDGKASMILADSVSTDGTAAFFTRDDLGKILKHRELIVGASEYLGPQVVMKFDVPEASQLLAACSADKVLARSMR